MPSTVTFTPLPVVERELRVASRKRNTFWTRVAAALVALVIGGGFMILHAQGSGGGGGPTLGRTLFALLTWLTLAAALSAGLFFTSDCLSEEKREGTLGLLFLTSLRGHDIVLGKLLATSLRGFYALVAVLPVLGITLLMGGVTGTQFLQTSLALLNALLASLATGLFVSALSRDSQKAMVGTVSLLGLWGGLGPATDGLLALFEGRTFQPWLSLSSPVYLFLLPGAWGRAPFWPGLWLNLAITGALLGMTSVLVRHTWQQRVGGVATAKGGWANWWKFGSARRRAALRRHLLDANPVLWLACRERWQATSLWAMSLLLAGAYAIVFGTDHEGAWWFAWNALFGLVTLVLYLGIASQAARQFLDARRNGLLELVLSTPLSTGQIVQGQWRALVRLFALPLGLCLATLCLGMVLVQQRMWDQIANAVPAATGPAGTTLVLAGFNPPGLAIAMTLAFATSLTVAANLVALSWFGMWMGLNSKSTNLATLKTFVLVQVIPWFAITFASTLCVPLLVLSTGFFGAATVPNRMMFWYPILMSAVGTVLHLAKDAGFFLYARAKLKAELRRRIWP